MSYFYFTETFRVVPDCGVKLQLTAILIRWGACEGN